MLGQITSASLLLASTFASLSYAHLYDPNDTSFTGYEGNCAGCIAARHNYCLNGLGDSNHTEDQYYGDCVMSRDQCYEPGSSPTNYYTSIMYFGGCEYGGVYHYNTLKPADQMMHVHINEAMGYQAHYWPFAMWDILMAPSTYQFLMIHDDQNHFPLALSFEGIWDHYTPNEKLKDMNSIERNKYLLQDVRVYFSQKEPSDKWGYPPQLDDLYAPEFTPLTDYDKKGFYVTLANPTSHTARVKVVLSVWDGAITQTVSLIAASLGAYLSLV